MNARCAVSIDERRAEMERALGYLSELHTHGLAACARPMEMAVSIWNRVQAERAAAAMTRRRLAGYQPSTLGAQRTMPVQCDQVMSGALLAGYEVDEDGNVGLTHLWANGSDIYLLVLELPEVMKQIETYIAEHEQPGDV